MEISGETRIVHLKSARELRTVEQRINQPHLRMYVDKYLTPNPIVAPETDREAAAALQDPTIQTSEPSNSMFQNISPQKKALLLQKLRKRG